MKLFRFLIFSIFIFIGFSTSAQFKFSGQGTVQGYYTSGEELPFWMYNNVRARVSEDSRLTGWISAMALENLSPNLTLEFGGGILFRDGKKDNIFIDEAYMHLETPHFYLTGGIKQQEVLYNGLSASNESMLWSLNARPMPGIQIGTRGTYFLDPYEDLGLGIEASWNEYLLEKDRYMSYAKVHYKKFFFVYQTYNDLKIKAGLRHYAQWGGTNPGGETRNETLDDYFKIISGMGSGISSYMGSYEFHVGKKFRQFEVEFFYNHIFESFAGAKFANAPDGCYGIFIKTRDQDRVINSFIYELYLTQNQNFPEKGIFQNENYFNDDTYKSGWTYNNRALGAPFFTTSIDNLGITNNRFT